MLMQKMLCIGIILCHKITLYPLVLSLLNAYAPALLLVKKNQGGNMCGTYLLLTNTSFS